MSHTTPKLILASLSPRRRQLLAESGYDFEVVPPNVDESLGLCSNCGPAELVADLARRKAADVVHHRLGGRHDRRAAVVACDTVAECGGQILGKPRDEDDARRMLTMLSGTEHRVYSGLCVWPIHGNEPAVRVAVTTLRMDTLSRDELDGYLASHQWEGKAGAFGFQDQLGWVHIVEGSESNVVGLPMELLGEMLSALSEGP